MNERYFVDETGKLLGVFAGGAVPDVEAVEVPSLPPVPGSIWAGGAWQEPAPEAPVLSPAQFEFLLALTGFGAVWDQLAQAAKSAGDLAQYAALMAERRRSRFEQERTLNVVAQFRPVVAQIAPEVDLSEQAIKAAWDQAAAWGGL